MIRLLGSGFGLGFLPKAPGTWGTLLGVGIGALALACPEPQLALFSAALVASLGGVWLARAAVRASGNADPQWFVVDEVAGYLVALMGVRSPERPWLLLAAAFVLFRIFDIAKPPPIRKVEEIPGGWGVVCDDVVAGLYASLVLIVVNLFL